MQETQCMGWLESQDSEPFNRDYKQCENPAKISMSVRLDKVSIRVKVCAECHDDIERTQEKSKAKVKKSKAKIEKCTICHKPITASDEVVRDMTYRTQAHDQCWTNLINNSAVYPRRIVPEDLLQ